MVWERLYDAAVFCVSQGFSVEHVSELSVPEFRELYHALMRIDARRKVELAVLMQNAYHAEAKGMKKFLDSLSVWLPKAERGMGKKSAEEFQRALKRA